jgi:trypsin
MRRLRHACTAAIAASAAAASPASAVVGGQDASPGEYPSVAKVVIAEAFQCTGTLIAPNWVLTAGHCSSITGGTGVASPIAFPPQALRVEIGATREGDDTADTPAVQRVVVPPDYLLSDRNDISLLQLSRASTKAPTQVAAAEERAIWEPGDLGTIAGWGVTEEDGDLPTTLQEAQVPITTDAYCQDAYGSGFDAETMVCAGFPQGGTDTCQGDSGGPLFARSATGVLRVVGATSFGEGCARPGKPGVYARVADTKLRTFIATTTGGTGVATATTTAPGDGGGTKGGKGTKGGGKGRKA